DAGHRWTAGEDLYAYKPPLDVYRNPPGIAAGFVPFTWMPERGAGLAWRWLSAAVFLVGLVAWARHGLPRPLKPWESGLLVALTVPFALPSLNNGQTNLIIIGLLLLGVTAVARTRHTAAGSWLALASYVKVYPAAVAMLLAAVSPKKLAPRFAVACGLLVALPFLFQSAGYVSGQYRSFRDASIAGDRTLAELPRAPRDLYLVLRVWATPPSQEVYTAIKLGAATGMAALVLLVWRRTRDMKSVAPLALGLGCVWMTVLGPATEVHTYTLLGPTTAAAVVFAIADRKWGMVALAVVGWALLISPVIRDMFPKGGPFQAMGPQPVGGVLLLVAIVWQAIRKPVEVVATPQAAEPDRVARAA
ncbi:MAG TPA: glycosyltransferase family 87 protein, partial [Gemmataceae bacterium]|nr:glycosyltransferase family 87 protein [Gemmataceae bacterium]